MMAAWKDFDRSRAPVAPPATAGSDGTVPQPRPERALLDATEVGRVLGFSRATVHALDAREELPAPVLVGRSRRWGRAELEAWVLHGTPRRGEWERLWPRVRKELLRR